MSTQANAKISPPGGAEPELIARARAGDREAFATLYNEHRDVVYRYLSNRARNQHLAEDLTQEVFVRALRRIGTFAWQGRDFCAWLLTIARNLHLDHVKSSRARLEVMVGEFHDADGQDGSAEMSALRDLDAVDARETLRAVMVTLNPHQRKCLELRFLGELSTEETAEEMGQTTGAVKTLTFRAVQKLRQELLPNAAEVAA